MERLVELGPEDAGEEVLTLQRAAYVTEGQAYDDVHLPPLRQTLTDLRAELADPQVVAVGWRNDDGRLLAAIRARNTSGTAVWRSADSRSSRTGKARGSDPNC
ncbi:hypothetical protein SAMN05661080_05018 [Modestobacter sp. DSM 44400]|nr:hypothetical protein SAMN05661080_05018 [Modestobacter sp. DSM 44400]